MGTWTARTTIDSQPDRVLELLTDPDAAARWAPVDFDVAELDGRRLETGAHAVLCGRLAGREIAFDVDVLEAGDGRLALRATGPVDMDVEYELSDAPLGTDVVARIAVHPGRGLAGRLIATATEALAPRSLETALAAIAREAESDARPLALAA